MSSSRLQPPAPWPSAAPGLFGPHLFCRRSSQRPFNGCVSRKARSSFVLNTFLIPQQTYDFWRAIEALAFAAIRTPAPLHRFAAALIAYILEVRSRRRAERVPEGRYKA